MELESTKRALLLCAGAVFVLWMLTSSPMAPFAASYSVASYEKTPASSRPTLIKAGLDLSVASAKAATAAQLGDAAPGAGSAAPDNTTTANATAPKPIVLASAEGGPISLPAQPDLQGAPAITVDAVDAGINPDNCVNDDACTDNYLWALYQRAPKTDSAVEHDQTKVTIKNKKGKKVTVTRTVSHVIEEDFTWKDPQSADKAGMSLKDYVIGGIDRAFKQRLFRALYAAAEAGQQPAITSGFRDDYRQSIATGLKAADNRSYHGGSLHGGYGHGLAADLVSIDGATRPDRLVSSQRLWKWIDDHAQAFMLGRPYLGYDPPHVAPLDGEEYAKHRGPPKLIEQASASATPAVATPAATAAAVAATPPAAAASTQAKP